MIRPHLPEGYRFVDLPNEEFQKIWTKWGTLIFDENSTNLDVRKVLSDQERAQLKELHKHTENLISIRIAIFKDDEFCGWFTGDQYNWETFYMRNSAILPAHRKQGLYTALMHEVLDRVQKLGFQVVLSRHATTNNAIIIPKLRAGFIITALEVSDRFGTLVHLSYFFNSTRRQVMDFRAGELKPTDKLKEAMGFK